MTLPPATYDLVMLLDPQAEDAARAKIVADSRAAIDAQGELVRHDEWGERPLAYPIEKRTSAEYHLLQFHASAPELMSGLSRTLGITDGVLRFRIVKLKPGVPDPPDMGSAAVRRESEGETTSAPPAPAPATEVPAAATEAPAPAEATAPEAELPPAAEQDAPQAAGSGEPVDEPAVTESS